MILKCAECWRLGNVWSELMTECEVSKWREFSWILLWRIRWSIGFLGLLKPMPQTGDMDDRNLLSRGSGGWKSAIRMLARWGPPWILNSLLLPVSSCGLPSVLTCAQVPFLTRTPVIQNWGPHPSPHFNLVTILKVLSPNVVTCRGTGS